MGMVKNVGCLLNSFSQSRLLAEFFFLFDLKFCFWFLKGEVLFRIFFLNFLFFFISKGFVEHKQVKLSDK